MLRDNAENFGDKVAYRDRRRAVGYGDLERRTRWLAGHLDLLGVERGALVAILLDNCVEAVESSLAITRAAAVSVPVNPRASDSEVRQLLRDVALVVTDERHVDQVLKTLPDAGQARVVVTGDDPATAGAPAGALMFENLAEIDPGTPARDDLGLDDVAWLLHTSGSTGHAKGVLLSQRAGLWSVSESFLPALKFTADDALLWPLPLFHSFAQSVCLLAVITAGAEATVLDGFQPQDVLQELGERRHTVLAGVPTTFHGLVEAARDGSTPPAPARVGLSAGAPCTPELRRAFEETFGVPLLNGYGTTETAGVIAVDRPVGSRVEGSCGPPVPGVELRLVDPQTLEEVFEDEGEIWVSGPGIMIGYRDLPEESAAALHDGWYRTGDLGIFEGGHLVVTGRLKDLIISGGQNIHPAEVERVLLTLPGVADAIVVGAAHEALGEVPEAFVVPGPGGVDPRALLAGCRAELPEYKVPVAVHLAEVLPKTSSGKPDRRAVALLTRAGRTER
uniref:PyrI3 n=1 Tax=Streptomyces rugosporus TaxID=295838 RepID=K7QSJ7_STRRG|nr:PyrI3 [Streptomyces rugosporus]